MVDDYGPSVSIELPQSDEYHNLKDLARSHE
jgi:hypothetical protein